MNIIRFTTETDTVPRIGVIDDGLVRLVERATPSKLVALTRRVRNRVRKHG